MKIFPQKLSIIFMFLIFVVSLTGCSDKQNDTVEINETVNDFITLYKGKNFNDMNELLENGNCPLNELYIPDMTESNIIFDNITNSLSYTIGDITLNDKTATVSVHSTNRDMQTIMPQVVNALLGANTERDDYNSDDLFINILNEYFEADTSVTEKDFTVNLVKSNNKWLIAENGTTELYDGLTGNYFSFVLSTSETLGAISDSINLEQ